MTRKQLIISLIQQDLKHSQLVTGLDQLGLDASNKHCLELLDIIADLMNVPEGHVEIVWGKMYVSLMAETVHFDIDLTPNVLKPYAENCYKELKLILKNGGLKSF